MFGVNEEEILYTKVTQYIPLEYEKELLETIRNDDDSYFDVFLKKSDNKLFPVLVSGQTLPLKDETYGIFTIVDVTALKEKEKEQVKKLKSHIITQATNYVNKENEIKGQTNNDILFMQEELNKVKSENNKLAKKISLLEKENMVFSHRCEKIKEDSFSFKEVLIREIAMARRFTTEFSLAVVEIDNYRSFVDKVNSESKKELVLRAFKKHFKSSIRTSDVIYYEDMGLFYLILANTPDVNLSDVIKRLLKVKKIDSDISVSFNYGMAHFFKNDTYEHILHRAKRNLDENKKNNKIIKSELN